MDQIYENVFNRTFDAERASLAALQRQLRLRYEELLTEEGVPENTVKRQRAMERLQASHLHSEYQRLCGELEAEENRRDMLLDELALRVELKPHQTMYLVEQVSVDVPRPPTVEAVDFLTPTRKMLESYGFKTYTRLTGDRHELWADCPLWMVDAAIRKS